MMGMLRLCNQGISSPSLTAIQPPLMGINRVYVTLTIARFLGGFLIHQSESSGFYRQNCHSPYQDDDLPVSPIHPCNHKKILRIFLLLAHGLQMKIGRSFQTPIQELSLIGLCHLQHILLFSFCLYYLLCIKRFATAHPEVEQQYVFRCAIGFVVYPFFFFIHPSPSSVVHRTLEMFCSRIPESAASPQECF